MSVSVGPISWFQYLLLRFLSHLQQHFSHSFPQLFYRHMMGKRVNFACRSVISPDPYIGTNEIGLPFYFAKTLTYPTPVTERNVEEMRELVTRGPHNYPGAVWVEFPDGRRVDLSKMGDNNRKAIASRLLPKVGLVTVGRQLRNGDMVLMNRQVRYSETNQSPFPPFSTVL